MLTSARVRAALLALGFLPTIATAHLLGGPDFQVSATTAGDQYLAGVATQGAGGTIVMWYDSVATRIQRYDADGAPVGSETTINGGGALAVAPSGNFVSVVGSVSAQFLDPSGVPLGAPVTVSVTSGGDGVDVARAGSGFVFAWSAFSDGDVRGIFARRYDDVGNPLGPAFPVNTGITGEQFTPVVAGDAAGNFTVGWQNGSALTARSFDATGTPLGPDYVVDPIGGSYYDISSNDAGTVAFVFYSSVVRVRLYGSTGTPLGSAFDVGAGGDEPVTVPHVALDSAGNIFAVWTNHNTVRALGRFHDATGTPLSPVFDVSAYPGWSFVPLVAAGANGGFFVAWTALQSSGRGRDGDGSGVFARRFAHAIGIGGRQVLIRDNLNATKRKIRFLTNDTVVSTSAGDGVDPVTDGAYLHVHGNGATTDSACMALPAGGWTASGDPAVPIFEYRDPDYLNGPCSKVSVRRGRISASCRASAMPITYSLDEPAQGAVGVRFVSGGSLYCAALGGTVVKDIQSSQFRARGAARPSICPTPPASCP